jgi:hypothetical protein
MKNIAQKLQFLLIALLFGMLSMQAQVLTGPVGNYGVYTLKSLSGGRFMQVGGDTLYNEKYKNSAPIVQHSAEIKGGEYQKYQRWHILYVTTEDEVNYYYLRNTMSGKLLAVPSGTGAAGTQLEQFSESTTPVNRMLWSITEVTPGKYRITNKGSGLAVTNQNSSTLNDTPITLEVSTEDDDQRWEINRQAPCTYRDDQVTRFFDRNTKSFGSAAFDQASSILLSNGKVLWVTQDSWDGSELQTNNLFYSNWFFMYGNSMYLQPSATDWAADKAPNITRENSAQGRPKQICDIQPNQTFAWPSNGVEIDGKVYLHCGEGSGLTGAKQTLYEIYPKTPGSLVWTSIRHEVPGLSNYNTVGYPNGMVKADDGYVYVFGSRTGLGFGYYLQIFVARFSQADPLNSWTFWNGTTWANKPPTTDAEYAKAKVFEGQGASAAVGYVNGKYVLITLDQGFWGTTDRYARGAISNTPISGFGKAKNLYAIREYIYGTKARYYSPNIHTQSTNGQDELLFTYSLNYSTDDKQDITVNASNQKIVNGVRVTKGAYIDPYFYRVKGVRVPFSMLGIPATVPAAINRPKETNTGLELYPNPAKDVLNLCVANSLDGANYEIFNVVGCRMQSGKIQERTVNVQTLPAGRYTLVVKGERTVASRGFIKQ